MVVVAAASAFVGIVILRRRGVYFSLLTLALAALTYTTCFRWSEVTGGEDGLGGLKRGSVLGISLDPTLNYYIVVALIGLAVLFVLLRITRSPFGHVLVAIRENPLRATFQGYPIERYRLAVFVISAVVTALPARLIAFQNYLVSAEAVSVPFAGELLAMVVIGGMRSLLGPGARRAFLHPVPRAVLDLDAELAALVRHRLRRLRAVLARWPGRHLGQAHAPHSPAARRDRRNEPAQDL